MKTYKLKRRKTRRMKNSKECNFNKSFKELFDSHYKDKLSLREFSRLISEDAVDVTRWLKGNVKITPRAVITICRLHPEIIPNELNPYVFPEDLKFEFSKKD